MADAKPRRKPIWRILGYAYLTALALVVLLGFRDERVRVCTACRAELVETQAGFRIGPWWEWVVRYGGHEVPRLAVESFVEPGHMHPAGRIRPLRTSTIALLGWSTDETPHGNGFADEISVPSFAELLRARIKDSTIGAGGVRSLIAFDGFDETAPDTAATRALLRQGTELVAEHRKVDARTLQLFPGVDVWAAPPAR